MSAAPLDRDETLDAALRALFVERPAPVGEHPAPDELLDYHLRTLPSEEEDRIEEHLARCAECARLVLDFAAFSDPDATPPARTAAQREAAWGRLQGRIEAAPRPAPPRPALGWRAPTPAWALAASLILAAGLFVWGLALRRQLSVALGPRAGATLVDLVPVGESARRGSLETTRIPLPAEGDRLALLLNVSEIHRFASYRMEVLTARGRPIWRASEVPYRAGGALLLELPAQSLSVESYRVRLFGSDGLARGEKEIAEYRFEVVAAAAGRQR